MVYRIPGPFYASYMPSIQHWITLLTNDTIPTLFVEFPVLSNGVRIHKLKNILENNLTKCPKEGVTVETSDVHYYMVANTEAVASVFAYSHRI